jgi:U2 small nuclear ribonucleoprotein B''
MLSIDIVAKKNGGGRGQAFVVFAEQSAATAAMRTLAGETFYDKPIVSPQSLTLFA